MNPENATQNTGRIRWAVITGAVIASAMVLVHGIRWQATVSAASSLHENVPTFLIAAGAAWGLITGLATFAAITAVARTRRIRRDRQAAIAISARDITPDWS
jgi:hypothetical protein